MHVERTDILVGQLDEHKTKLAEQRTNEVKPRNYFRGSEVGKCSNQINFTRQGGIVVGDLNLVKSRFLDDGHLHQAVLSKEFGDAGVKVYGEEEGIDEEIEVGKTTIRIIAHKDGTVKVGKEEQLLEVKSVKEKRFEEISKTNDVSQYYAQIQIYMYLWGYKRCKNIIVDRNNSGRLEYTIDLDMDEVKKILKKLAQVERDLAAGVQSSRDYPRNSKECGWCPYYEQCWGIKRGGFRGKDEQEKKAVEVEGKTDEKVWHLALDLYRKSKRLGTEASEYKAEADALMEGLFKKFKATQLHGDGGSVTRSLSQRMVPDKNTISDLVQRGVIPVEFSDSVSLRYNIAKEEEE